jgi:catechol 2,3-dioxygenase-like lactoylglutathione lyase family enzyme
MQQATNLQINALQHIGIPVTDVANSQLFYERLGFASVMKAGFGTEEQRGICVMMKRGNMVIELYQLPDAELAAIRARANGHIDHVAFDVSDIDATYGIIKEAGFNIIEPEPVFLQFWERGCKYFNITGPDGERLEFNQVL